MYKLINDNSPDRVELAAVRLLEMAERITGEDRADQYQYVSTMLSQWSTEMDPNLSTELRLACYRVLFN